MKEGRNTSVISNRYISTTMDILEIRMSVRVDRRRGRRPYRSTKNEERRQPTYEWIRGERESLLTTAITDIPILAQAADPMDNPT